MSCIFIVYDERYHTDPDSASVLTATEKVKDAIEERNKFFPFGVIVRAWYKKIDGENTITQEEVVNILSPEQEKALK